MSDLNLENIVGFKAVDKNGNEQNVTVDEMVDMVSTRIVMALSETSTFAAAAAAGTDEFEDQLPQSDTFSWLRYFGIAEKRKSVWQNHRKTRQKKKIL